MGLGSIIGGGFGGIGGAILGGIADNLFADERQDDAQNFAETQAYNTQRFNSAQAAEQRAWASEMSNSAYQRQVKDLAAAGLNPMLGFMKGTGGAPVPPAASATSSPASAGIASPGHTNITAALQSASQIELNEAAADKIRAETKEVEARTPTHAVSIDKMKQEIGESAMRIERIIEETRHHASSAKHLDQQVINLKATVPLIKQQIDQLNALTQQQTAATDEIRQRVRAQLPQLEAILKDLERQARQLDIPGRANQSGAQESFVGVLGAYLRAINPLNAILNLAK